MVFNAYREEQHIDDDAYLTHVNNTFISSDMTILSTKACLKCLDQPFLYEPTSADRVVDIHHVPLHGHRTNPFVESSEILMTACPACNIRVGNSNWMHFPRYPRIESRRQHTLLIKNIVNSAQFVFRRGDENCSLTLNSDWSK